MVNIATKIIVRGKSPPQIYNWLISLTPDKYHQWHPKTHINFYRSGDTIWFEEILDGLKVNYRWKLIELEEHESILMKAKFYPIYLQLWLSPINRDTEVIHEFRVGFSFWRLEKIFDWFVRRFILTPRKIEAVKRHAIEEFKNLENIL